MSVLDDFTKDQRDLLVALPYRVGRWIGAADSTGGDDASVAEMQALDLIVTGFSEDFLKSEFVQAMVEETVTRKSEWSSWEQRLSDVPNECVRAISLLADRLDRKEVASLKLTLMEIGTAVAMAYREFDHGAALPTRFRLYSRIMMDKLSAGLSGRRPQNLDEILNISELERKALQSLSQALGLDKGGERNPVSTRKTA